MTSLATPDKIKLARWLLEAKGDLTQDTLDEFAGAMPDLNPAAILRFANVMGFPDRDKIAATLDRLTERWESEGRPTTDATTAPLPRRPKPPIMVHPAPEPVEAAARIHEVLDRLAPGPAVTSPKPDPNPESEPDSNSDSTEVAWVEISAGGGVTPDSWTSADELLAAVAASAYATELAAELADAVLSLNNLHLVWRATERRRDLEARRDELTAELVEIQAELNNLFGTDRDVPPPAPAPSKDEARRTPGTLDLPRDTSGRVDLDALGVTAAQVRTWCHDNNVEVSTTGRVGEASVRAYLDGIAA